MPRISQKTKLLELLTGSILSDILYLHILQAYKWLELPTLLLVENGDNSGFQQFKNIFNSPEAVEFLKFLKVDFVWNSLLPADQNSTIQ